MIIRIIFVFLNALYDNGKRFVDHRPRFMFRALSVILISYFTKGNFFINLAENIVFFYCIFDYLLNIFEGRKWYYIGNTAWWDIQRNKIQNFIPYFDIISKTLLLIIIIYIKCQYNS